MAGQVALVTGAGQGIGAAVARRLASDGYGVSVVDLNEHAAVEVALQIQAAGGTARAIACDVSKTAEVRSAMTRTKQDLGPVAVLVNNAGVGGPFHRVDEVSDEEWDWIMQTNLKSVFLFCREALPEMKAMQYGRIVNIASIQGFLGAATSSTYVASKHAVLGYTRAIAAEWGASGITCNAVCPGYVNTRMGIQDDQVSDHLQRVLARTPVQRVASPKEIATMVANLVGPDSGYINGASFVMDGGISAHVGI